MCIKVDLPNKYVLLSKTSLIPTERCSIGHTSNNVRLTSNIVLNY